MARKEKAVKAAKTAKAPKGGKRGKKQEQPQDGGQIELPPFVPVEPVVDLLPRSVREGVAVRRTLKQTVGIGIGAFAVFTLAFVSQQGLIVKAQSDLSGEEGRASVLTKQAKKYLPVRVYFSQIESNALQIVTNMSKEVAWQKTLETTQQVATRGSVRIESVDVNIDTSVGGAQNANAPATSTTEVASGCPQIDLFAQNAPAVGCAQISGNASSRSDLSAWVEAMEGESLFVSPFISDSTSDNGKGRISFTASVGLTAKVFTFRYNSEYLKGDVDVPTR